MNAIWTRGGLAKAPGPELSGELSSTSAALTLHNNPTSQQPRPPLTPTLRRLTSTEIPL
ncbi:predicted protein [Plenodomus lingam JN3]|uniref:Predicted protein n=1 Tax=Leptosphaeria maculans (strain JN3 / isolate v23.1.3 / race Av1-4-5-6-7-8) TaxID=985895 RepID=E5A0I6_LEPMJ|nr:predicted protein [Plenodomus lingam JN3]CBX97046.1 predicted protein [Plenodomus lingam JN3]